MFRISEHPQGSEEWFQERLGKVTGSVASKIITRTGKKSSSIDGIVNRAVAELIMQVPDETFQSDSMLRGKELEEQALEYFNIVYDYNFKKCGFLEALDEAGSSLGYGASPDGIDLDQLVGLELKCPEAHTHLAYMTSGELPDEYFQQVQMALKVTGWKKWIFGSYHPSFPCVHIEVPRDEDFISKMKPLVTETCEQIKERHLSIKKMLESVA